MTFIRHNITMNEAILLETIQFAAKAHKDQRRKGINGEPYINHPIEVASLLSNVASVSDIELLQAAILHDTIEDTDVTEETILKRFGETVLHYVKEVTDDKSLPLTERRKLQIEKVQSSSKEIRLLKLADHCSNVASIPSTWNKKRCESYLAWSAKVADYCFQESVSLSLVYKERHAKTSKRIAQLP